MSNRCTGAVFERYPAGGGEFALALALADNAHQDGTHIFVSVETMAQKSRQSVRAVQNHLRNMLACGWLCVTRGGGGRGRYAEYHISPAWLNGAELAPFISPPKVPKEQANGADSAGFDAAERVQNDALKGADSCTPYITERTLLPPTPLAGGVPGKKPKPEAGTLAPGFDAIAAEYPRRAGIEAARRVWNELRPDAQLQAEMARALRAWIPSAEWQREGGRFIPKFGKWLRDQRWLDAPGMAADQPASSPVLPRERDLSPEQLQANKARASEAAALARRVMGERKSVSA